MPSPVRSATAASEVSVDQLAGVSSCQDCSITASEREAGAVLAGGVAERVGDGVVDLEVQLRVLGQLVDLGPELLEPRELAGLRRPAGPWRRASAARASGSGVSSADRCIARHASA